MSELKTFEGRSAAEAAINACEALGVTRSELKYEILSESGEGFEKRVEIAVQAVQVQQSASEKPAARSERDPEGRRSQPQKSRQRRGERGRTRGDRGEQTADGRLPGDSVDDLITLEAVPDEPEPESVGLDEASVGPVASKGREVLARILELGGFDAGVRVVREESDEVLLEVVGKERARVIGNRGDSLLALQFIVNRMVSRDVEADQIVVLDAANYRTRRRDALAGLAAQLAERASRQQKVVKLSPMSPHDRRIFHRAVSDIDGVGTRSEGSGFYRSMLIIPDAYRAESDSE